MNTIVYQSYRTRDVPAWISRCMQPVKAWAGAQRFDYRFIDDRLFDYCPEWYRQGAGANVQVITNLARLVVAKELLAAGHERTIWIDADVLVFDSEAFRIEVNREFAFCHQVWVETRMDAIAKWVASTIPLPCSCAEIPFSIFASGPMRIWCAAGRRCCGKVHKGHMLGDGDFDAIVDAMERTRGAMFRNAAEIDSGSTTPVWSHGDSDEPA